MDSAEKHVTQAAKLPKGELILRLVLDVHYDTGTTPTDELKQRLARVADNAIGRGEVTGESEASVVSWGYRVEEPPSSDIL